MLRLEGDQDFIRIGCSGLINAWLVVVTLMLGRILKAETEDWTLMKDNRRLLVVVCSFVIAYSGWLINDICVTAMGYNNIFVMHMSWLLIPTSCNYIPIGLVLYLHSQNSQSLVRVIMKWVQDIPTD